jgi:hypothetical protein
MKRFIVFFFVLIVATIIAFPITAIALPDQTSICKARKMDATGIYAQRVVQCWLRALRNTETTDPETFIESQPASGCIDQMVVRLEDRWDHADTRAETKGSVCLTTAGCVEIEGYVDDAVQEILEALLYGGDGKASEYNEFDIQAGGDDDLDLADRAVKKLMAEILRASEKKFMRVLRAESQNMLKENEEKLELRKARADHRFSRHFDRAAGRAERKNVNCAVDAAGIKAIIDAAVADVVAGMMSP